MPADTPSLSRPSSPDVTHATPAMVAAVRRALALAMDEASDGQIERALNIALHMPCVASPVREGTGQVVAWRFTHHFAPTYYHDDPATLSHAREVYEEESGWVMAALSPAPVSGKGTDPPRLATLLASLKGLGCTDGGCVVDPPPRGSMHTNGGCRCLDLHQQLPFKLRCTLKALLFDLRKCADPPPSSGAGATEQQAFALLNANGSLRLPLSAKQADDITRLLEVHAPAAEDVTNLQVALGMYSLWMRTDGEYGGATAAAQIAEAWLVVDGKKRVLSPPFEEEYEAREALKRCSAECSVIGLYREGAPPHPGGET